MTSPEPDVVARTARSSFVALGAAAGADARRSAELHAELVARHGEPHRAYHVLDHVGWVLHHLDTTASGLADRRSVELAVWFHDAVYDPRRSDNEEASALLAAGELLEAGTDPEVVADVVRLVRVTGGHQAGRADEAALCDADLAVLGAGEEAYAAYVRAVRAEYGFVDDAAWAVGRAAVLRSLLELPRLYHHPAFADRELQARANLTRELEGLEGTRRS